MIQNRYWILFLAIIGVLSVGAVDGIALDRNQVFRLALASDPEICAVEIDLETNAMQRQLTEMNYGFHLDSSLAAYRDRDTFNQLLINDLNQTPFDDYQSSRTILNFEMQYKAFDFAKDLELSLLNGEKKIMEELLNKKMRHLQLRMQLSLARLWVLKDYEITLADQRFLLELLKKTVDKKRQMGVARVSEVERVTLLKNWLQNDENIQSILKQSELYKLKILLGDSPSQEEWEEVVDREDYEFILNFAADQGDMLSSQQVQNQIDAAEMRLTYFDAMNRRWKITIGGRYYGDTQTYELSTDTNLDLQGSASVQDYFGTSGFLFGYDGTFANGFLGFAKMDLNLWGKNSSEERKILESQIQSLQQKKEQSKKESLTKIMENQDSLAVLKGILETRQRNLNILEHMEILERHDFKDGRESLENLIRFEMELNQEASQLRQNRLDVIDRTAQLVDSLED